MYICKECGRIFEEPKHHYGEHLEHFGFPCREGWTGCPSCGGVYTEAFKCDGCGEYIMGEYIKTIDYQYYCKDCIEMRDTDND